MGELENLTRSTKRRPGEGAELSEEANAAFGATLAEHYDRRLVPLLFAPYAEYLAQRARKLGPDNVLEIAAGTGVLTQALVKTLPAEVAITATDLSEAMLERARAKSAGSAVRWRQADAMQLPFPNETFDLIVCQFGVMFFPDKTESFREAARLLKTPGHYLFAVWGDWKQMPEAPLAVAADAVAEMLSCDPASLVNPAYNDEATIRQDLTAAQFQGVEVDRVSLPAAAASAREAAVAMVQGSLIRTAIEARCPGRFDEATDVVESALQAKFGLGAIAGRTNALIVSATKA